MKRFFLFTGMLISLAVLLAGCQRPSGHPEIVIENVWSRPVLISSAADTAAGSGYNGAAYLTIKNRGRVADRLIGAHTNVCAVTEIHRSFIDNDRMMMEPVPRGIEVPATGSVALKPGGYHLMLMGLKTSLSEGDSFAVQLQFEKSGLRTVHAKIKKY